MEMGRSIMKVPSGRVGRGGEERGWGRQGGGGGGKEGVGGEVGRQGGGD